MSADPQKLKVVKQVNRKDIPFSMARLPGSSRLFFGSSDFNVYDIDVQADKPEAKSLSGHKSYVTGVAATGNVVVSGSYDGHLIWWDATTHEQIRRFRAHERCDVSGLLDRAIAEAVLLAERDAALLEEVEVVAVPHDTHHVDLVEARAHLGRGFEELLGRVFPAAPLHSLDSPNST